MRGFPNIARILIHVGVHAKRMALDPMRQTARLLARDFQFVWVGLSEITCLAFLLPGATPYREQP